MASAEFPTISHRKGNFVTRVEAILVLVKSPKLLGRRFEYSANRSIALGFGKYNL